VVQTQDLTVINITKEAVISDRRGNGSVPPIAGQQRAAFQPVQDFAPAGGRRRSSLSTEL